MIVAKTKYQPTISPFNNVIPRSRPATLPSNNVNGQSCLPTIQQFQLYTHLQLHLLTVTFIYLQLLIFTDTCLQLVTLTLTLTYAYIHLLTVTSICVHTLTLPHSYLLDIYGCLHVLIPTYTCSDSKQPGNSIPITSRFLK